MRNLQKLAASTLEEVLAGSALHQVLPHRLQQLQTPGFEFPVQAGVKSQRFR